MVANRFGYVSVYGQVCAAGGHDITLRRLCNTDNRYAFQEETEIMKCKHCGGTPVLADMACGKCLAEMDAWTLRRLGLVPDYSRKIVLPDGTPAYRMRKGEVDAG